MYSDFTLSILRWFETHKRALPWRETKDPYAIWLSEVILQQTRIQQGQAYWERFMHRWPTVFALAAASEDEVLREWQGLGYYSRARNLHTAAHQIVTSGSFPTTYNEIRKLKGVGDYTAAAIASIAFDLPHAVVDGNVYRVLSRYFGIDTPINSTEGKKLFAALAQEMLPVDQPSAFNQAMMDFGAIQCTPQSPDCSMCPLVETCEACRLKRITELPVKLKTIKIRKRHFSYYYIRYKKGDEVYTAIRQRGGGDIWQGLWEPLMIEGDVEPDIFYHARKTILRREVKHILTHQHLFADFYLVETEKKPTLGDDFLWIIEEDLDQYALPRLVELLVESLPR